MFSDTQLMLGDMHAHLARRLKQSTVAAEGLGRASAPEGVRAHHGGSEQALARVGRGALRPLHRVAGVS